MPHFNSSFFELLKDYTSDFFDKYSVFIETGTYNGNTTFAMEPYFNEIHTIEIDKNIYENTKSNYNGNKIKFYLGDSSIVLKDICENINQPAIFFLDGHWSAGNTGKGEKDCPLYEELENIMTHFKHSAIIIIDDYFLFGKGPSTNTNICNWEDISKENVIKITSNRLIDNYILNQITNDDRLILHIKQI